MAALPAGVAKFSMCETGEDLERHLDMPLRHGECDKELHIESPGEVEVGSNAFSEVIVHGGAVAVQAASPSGVTGSKLDCSVGQHVECDKVEHIESADVFVFGGIQVVGEEIEPGGAVAAMAASTPGRPRSSLLHGRCSTAAAYFVLGWLGLMGGLGCGDTFGPKVVAETIVGGEVFAGCGFEEYFGDDLEEDGAAMCSGRFKGGP